MKLIIYIFFLLFSFFVSAKEEMGVPWNIDCDENNCFMQVVLPYQGPTEMEQGGMSVSFSLKKNIPHVIGFYLPANIDTDAGLIIDFVDTVPDGQSFKLEPAGSMIRLPINNCNKSYCSSLVYQEIQSVDDREIDLIEELLIREHVWLLFKRNGKEETMMLPTYKFRDEFVNLPK